MPFSNTLSADFSSAVKVLPPPENVTVPQLPSKGTIALVVDFGVELGEGEEVGEALGVGVAEALAEGAGDGVAVAAADASAAVKYLNAKPFKSGFAPLIT